MGLVCASFYPKRVTAVFVSALWLLWACSSALAAEGNGTVYIPNSIDDPALHSVSLPDLDGTGYLRGSYADVTNSLIDRAFSSTNQFNFDPISPGDDRIHFAETMAYYHMSAYNEYLRSLGCNVVQFPIQTTVFAAEQLGPMWIPIPTEYRHDTKEIVFSASLDMANSDALDADVIIHEYVHAIEHDLLGGVPGQFTSTETTLNEQALALMEAIRDYLAASHFDDAEIGEGYAQIWELGEYIRNVNNWRRWPDDFTPGGQYGTGMIFSGALWDLRSVIGSEAADTLALASIQLLPDNDPGTPELNTTFADALGAILQADVNLYGGAHEQEIRQAFAVHGIGTFDFSTPYPMVWDPGNDYDGMETYTDPGAHALSITFDEFVTKLDNSPFTKDESPILGVDEKSTTDLLTILDGSDTLVGTFTGRELQGATVIVPGDTVKFHLVTDSYLAPFGYRVVDITAIPEPVPPTVVNVLVSSTAWTSSFLTALGSTGYSIPVGTSDQLAALPWIDIDLIQIVFSKDVTVQQGDLSLAGVNVPAYAFSGFSYDANGLTATWMLSAPVGPDKLLIALGDTVEDQLGNALDGEWTDSVSTYPSGDGVAGGGFSFRFNVLPGDVNQNGSVFGNDVILTRNAQFKFPGNAGYSIFYDVNGSGSIFGDDVILVRNRQFTFLPSGEPEILTATQHTGKGPGPRTRGLAGRPGRQYRHTMK